MNDDAILSVLGRLRAVRIDFRCVARDTIRYGEFPGSALRGGWLAGLLDVGCVVPARDCPRCDLAPDCAVVRISGEAERASPTRTPLYRIRFPRAPATSEPGTRFEFGLDLFGTATELRPLAIAAVERLAERGFGRRRARFEIESTVDHAKADGPTIERSLRAIAASLPPDELVIRCESPLRLVADGRALKRFSCDTFVNSLLRRARLLLESGEGVALVVDAAAVRHHAAQVRVVRDHLSKQDQVRYSARQGRSMNLHGAMGDVVIAGELAPLAPWLAFGVLAGAGKGATFGHGVISLHAGPVAGVAGR